MNLTWTFCIVQQRDGGRGWTCTSSKYFCRTSSEGYRWTWLAACWDLTALQSRDRSHVSSSHRSLSRPAPNNPTTTTHFLTSEKKSLNHCVKLLGFGSFYWLESRVTEVLTGLPEHTTSRKLNLMIANQITILSKHKAQADQSQHLWSHVGHIFPMWRSFSEKMCISSVTLFYTKWRLNADWTPKLHHTS